jgi:hypothetical protein
MVISKTKQKDKIKNKKLQKVMQNSPIYRGKSLRIVLIDTPGTLIKITKRKKS